MVNSAVLLGVGDPMTVCVASEMLTSGTAEAVFKVMTIQGWRW